MTQFWTRLSNSSEFETISKKDVFDNLLTQEELDNRFAELRNQGQTRIYVTSPSVYRYIYTNERKVELETALDF